MEQTPINQVHLFFPSLIFFLNLFSSLVKCQLTNFQISDLHWEIFYRAELCKSQTILTTPKFIMFVTHIFYDLA